MRSSLRQIVRDPGYFVVVAGLFALGIGVNTALFSIFNSLSLRPLPVRDPDRLALVSGGSWSYPIWMEIQARETELFDGAVAWSAQRFDLSTGGQADPVDGAFVSGRFFDVMGINAIRGRLLTAADEAAAPDGPVAVISYRFWQQRFAGASDVVGRAVSVQRIPFTIVGVMPSGFFGPDVGRMADVMVPFSGERFIRGKESRLASANSYWLRIMLRLKPGQSIPQGGAALAGIQQIRTLQLARTRNPEPLTLEPAANGSSALRSRFETPLVAMAIAVGLVLLAACANIASLTLARTLSRRREISVRLALGGSRWRIARLLFVESLIVAVMGTALGLMFASWSSALLVRQLSTRQNVVSLALTLDWRVLAFTGALACFSALAASVAPMLGLKRLEPGDALKSAGRGITGDARLALRGTLVIAQIAVTFVLVVAAGLFLRTLTSLNRLPLGFVPEPLIMAELNLQAGGGPTEARAARVERLRAAAAAVPGVRSASVSARRRLTDGRWSTGLVGIADGALQPTKPDLFLDATAPGWFETMGIPLRGGRDFTAGDRSGAHPVAIVNEAFVRRYLPGQRAIGQHVRLPFDPLAVTPGFVTTGPFEIVGVVADAIYTTPRDGMPATLYVPVAQRKASEFWPTILLTVNASRGARATVERDVAAALTKADPSIAFTFETFDQMVGATVTQERLVAVLSAFFGGLTLLLAAVGLYGAVAQAVRARRAEIGVRVALGATPSSVLRLIFQRVGVLLAAGLVAGLAGGLWAARFVKVLLFGLEPRDPATFAGAAAVLLIVGVLAAWRPARRAARLDPVAALRAD